LPALIAPTPVHRRRAALDGRAPALSLPIALEASTVRR
jgi:hypothetical protein